MNATHTNQSPLETPGIRTNAATALERGAHDILNYTQYAMVFFFRGFGTPPRQSAPNVFDRYTISYMRK